MITQQSWPIYTQAKCIAESVTIAVQICGKLRGTTSIAVQAGQDEAYAAALTIEKVAEQIKDKEIVKIIYVKAKLINIVVK